MATVFITGVAGFVGTHLCDLLLSQGRRVVGIDMHPSWHRENVEYVQTGVNDTHALTELLRAAAPVQVYHLAGMSFPPDADKSPTQALEVNIMGGVSLMEAVRDACPGATVLLVGSSKVYATQHVEGMLSEDSLVAPESFYGISKYAAELIGGQFIRQMGLDVRFTRSFNHTGPGQSPRFVCSDWARQAARISLGRQEPVVRVGDLSVALDFSDVRDVVAAYSAIVVSGRRGQVYNVSCGHSVALSTVLDHLKAKAGTAVRVETDEGRTRGHAAVPPVAGDNRRLREHTGWAPRYSLEQTLDDLFDYWVAQER